MTACLSPLSLLCLALALTACSGSSDEPAAVPLQDPDASDPESGSGAESDPDTTPDTTPDATPDPVAAAPPPGDGEQHDDSNPFEAPNPEGATVLERMGYRGAAEEADRLLSTDYLNVYREAVDDIRLLAEGVTLGVAPVSVACPLGGNALISRPEAGTEGEGNLLRFTFELCALGPATLTGQLDQRLTQVGAKFNNDRQLDSQFVHLVLDQQDGLRLRLDGNSKDDRKEVFVPICGTVPAVLLEHEVALESVTVTSAEDGTTRLLDALYNAQDENIFEDREACNRERRISFNGSATVVLASEPGGAVTLGLSKSGTLLRDDDEAPPTGGQAMLVATSSDDAAMSVTTVDDAAGLAQFDLRAGSAVASFIDTYTFEP